MMQDGIRNPKLLFIPVGLVICAILYIQFRPDGETETEPEPDIAILQDEKLVLLPVPKKPSFASIKDVKTKKEAFFSYLLPMVRNANAKVMVDRRFLLKVRKSLINDKPIHQNSYDRLNALAEKYKIPLSEQGFDLALIDALLRRCDVVPASLVLAQGANESAWGTSRFAVDANNLFGIWCFKPGCGLKPSQRDQGASHEVAKFPNVQTGVDYYVANINTNDAYKKLRRIRAELRATNTQITGHHLADGLLSYSERGAAYVQEIKAMIEFNKLSEFTLSTVEAQNK